MERFFRFIIHGFVILIAVLVSTIICSTTSENKGFADLKFIVELPHCRIPEVPLMNEAIKKDWENIIQDSTCGPQPPLFTQNENTLRLTNYSYGAADCCMTEVMRPELLINDSFLLSSCLPLKENGLISVEDKEFIIINCTKGNNRSMAYYHNIPLNSAALMKANAWSLKNLGQEDWPFSIMIIMLDAISRTHAYRSLPLTMDFLMNSMNFVDYKGFHCVGEPTIENLVPLTLGIMTDDNWEKHKPNYTGKYDTLPFIWKNFSDANYVTMHIEDATLWHTFNFNGREGFTFKPMDYYVRPYMMAQTNLSAIEMTKHYGITYSDVHWEYDPQVCAEGRRVWDFMLNYGKEFLKKINPSVVPSFGINWFVWPHHDYIPTLKWLDVDFLKMFQYVNDSPKVKDNTIIFFMGDHGFRWANYSNSAEGLLERDLPMLFARFPPRFEKKFPHLASAFRQNANRITTHVDLFKTFAHLHQIALGNEMYDSTTSKQYGYDRSYGQSLLTPIANERTCDDAKIPKRFCACNYPLYTDNYNVTGFLKNPVIEGISKKS